MALEKRELTLLYRTSVPIDLLVAGGILTKDDL